MSSQRAALTDNWRLDLHYLSQKKIQRHKVSQERYITWAYSYSTTYENVVFSRWPVVISHLHVEIVGHKKGFPGHWCLEWHYWY